VFPSYLIAASFETDGVVARSLKELYIQLTTSTPACEAFQAPRRMVSITFAIDISLHHDVTLGEGDPLKLFLANIAQGRVGNKRISFFHEVILLISHIGKVPESTSK